MDPTAIERYSRQIALPQVGQEGQEALARKSALVVGAGGLGSPAASYLVGMGVGRVTIVDRDVVALSNLPRQVFYTEGDLGKLKAETLARRLGQLNSTVTVDYLTCDFLAEDQTPLVGRYDVVLSCVDNLETRYRLNETCVRAGIPMVEGAVSGFVGLLTVIRPGAGPCYECIFPRRPSPSGRIPIASPLPGIVGAMEAMEAMKLLLNMGTPLVGKLFFIDLLAGESRVVPVQPRQDCPICGGGGKNSPSQSQSAC